MQKIKIFIFWVTFTWLKKRKLYFKIKPYSVTYQWKGILYKQYGVRKKVNTIFIGNGFDFFLFWRLLKKHSVNDFILFSYMLSHPNTTQKCRETHMQLCDFSLDLFWKHSDLLTQPYPYHLFKLDVCMNKILLITDL